MTPAQVRDQVQRLRREQGLSEHVNADRFLADLAAQVLAQAEDITKGNAA